MAKQSNDQIILDQIITQRKNEMGGALDDAEFFEIFLQSNC